MNRDSGRTRSGRWVTDDYSKPHAHKHLIPDSILDECIAHVVHNHYNTMEETKVVHGFIQAVLQKYHCSILYLFNAMITL